jgi:hypothetical protein
MNQLILRVRDGATGIWPMELLFNRMLLGDGARKDAAGV